MLNRTEPLVYPSFERGRDVPEICRVFKKTTLDYLCHMANKRKGQLSTTSEWAKHLRAYLKRKFWKSERRAGKDEIKRQVKEHG